MECPAAAPSEGRGGSRRAVRLAGITAVAVFLGLVARFWHPVWGLTAFIQLDASYDAKKIEAFRAQPVYVFRDSGPYDGIAYSQIAYHPMLRADELRTAVDNLAYRARRILPSALAWLLAGGDPARIVQVYVLLNVAAWLALAAILWRLLAVDDFRSWLAWAGLLFSAGALASVREALTDLIALCFLAGAMLAKERNHPRIAPGWLAAAALSRETSLAALPGLWTKPWLSGANARRTLIAGAPLALWMLYIRSQVGPASQGWSNFALPIAGLAEKWTASIAAAGLPHDRVLGWTTLLATAGLTAQASFLLLRPRIADPWWRIGGAYGVMMLLLGTAVWEGYPGAAQRVLLPMSLAFFVTARRQRASTAWLLAGGLTVFAGLLPLLDAPFDIREMAAARHADDACIVRVGDGWFGSERTRRHIWAWSQGDAHLDIRSWPRAERTWRIDFSMRSLVPRTVEILQDGRELWRGTIGAARTPVAVTFRAAGGGARLDFLTDAPAVPEGADPGARRLAFALYDPQVNVTDSR